MDRSPKAKAASPAVNAAVSSLRCVCSMLLASSVCCFVTSWPWQVSAATRTSAILCDTQPPTSTTPGTPLTVTSQQLQSWKDGDIPNAIHTTANDTKFISHAFDLRLFQTNLTSGHAQLCKVDKDGSRFCNYSLVKKETPQLYSAMSTTNSSYCFCNFQYDDGEYQIKNASCVRHLFTSKSSMVAYIRNPVLLPLFRFKVNAEPLKKLHMRWNLTVHSGLHLRGLENVSIFLGYDRLVVLPESGLCKEFELDLTRSKAAYIARSNAKVFRSGVLLGDEEIQATIVNISEWRYRINVCLSNLTAPLPNGTYQLLVYVTDQFYTNRDVGQTLWHSFTLHDLRRPPNTRISSQPTSTQPAAASVYPNTTNMQPGGSTSMRSLTSPPATSPTTVDVLQPPAENTSQALIYIVTSSVIFVLVILAIFALCFLRQTCRKSIKLSDIAAAMVANKDSRESFSSANSTDSNSTLLRSVSVAESSCTRTYSTEPGQDKTEPLEVLYEPCHLYAVLNDVTPRPPSAPLPSSASTVPPARSGQQTDPTFVMKTRSATTLPPAQHGQPTPPKKTRSASTTPCSESVGYMDMTLVSGHVGDKHSPSRQQMTIKTTIHGQQPHTSLQAASPGRRPLPNTEGQLTVNNEPHSVPTTPEVAVPRSYYAVATAATTATAATSSTFHAGPVTMEMDEMEEYLPMTSVMGESHGRSLSSPASDQGPVEVLYLNATPQITITVGHQNSTFLAKSADRSPVPMAAPDQQGRSAHET